LDDEDEWLSASAGTRVGGARPAIDLDGTTDGVVPQDGLERYRVSGGCHLLFLDIRRYLKNKKLQGESAENFSLGSPGKSVSGRLETSSS